ncbi:MAG: LysR family transcriptional regulator [Proteobacteria bacterium]|nr:LysR family transcriptional regulator [Pseudomonadota bacterium]
MSVAPPRPKGPPLNAMRAFEAAARHCSFVAAGEELNVTPGAVSQHVKTLETWSGVSLFQRNAQGVELTAAGRSLLKDFSDAFDAIAVATHSLRNLSPDADVHIAALPSIAQLWLPTRLGKIRGHFPDLNFSVTALETPPSLTRDLFDLSVFFGVPDDSLNQIVLAPDEVFPVCSPKLAKQIAKGQKLDSFALLHDQTWHDDWATWSKNSGIPLEDPESGPRYSLYSLAVEEAKAGAGILLGHTCLLEEALAAGTLVPVFDKSYSSGRSLILSLPHASRRRAEINDIGKLLQL